MKSRTAALLFVALLPTAAQATYIDPQGREWRELTDTLNRSYNAINTGGINGCSAATGACSGLLGGAGPSVDGWTWATEAEVRTLFFDLGIPGFNPLPAFPTSYSETPNSAWAPAIIERHGAFGPDSGLFLSTFDTGDPPVNVPVPSSGILGLTRTVQQTPSIVLGVLRPRVFDSYGLHSTDDLASTSDLVGLDETNLAVGIWMFRPAVSVPAASTASLLGIGLLACLAGRRRSTRCRA